jgi:hypothetical protein
MLFDSYPSPTPSSLQIVDEALGQAITLEKIGFPDAVVWNPWIDKAKSMADFGDEEYKVGYGQTDFVSFFGGFLHKRLVGPLQSI